ncbi:hypothetical protein LTS18_014292, partial [Coniosporium uncinatum]
MGIIQDPPVTWTGDLPFDDDDNELSCPARLPPQVKWVGRARKPQAGEVEHKAFEVKPMLDDHQNLPPMEEQFHRRHGEDHADDRDMCQGRGSVGEIVSGVTKGGSRIVALPLSQVTCFYWTCGRCKRRPACPYAHHDTGVVQLKPFGDTTCFFWKMFGGDCKQGDACAYAHEEKGKI